MKITKQQLNTLLQGLDLIRGVVVEAIEGDEVSPVAPKGTETVINNVVNIDTAKKEKAVTEEPTESDIDLESLSFNEIKALCKEHGIPVKGTKAVLIEQLTSVLNKEEIEVETPEEPEVVDQEEETEEEVENNEAPIEGNEIEDQLTEMTIEELSDLLSSVGITPKGKKQALIAKVLKAVEEGLIELDTEDEEEETEVETTEAVEGEVEIDTEELEAVLVELDVKTLKAVCKELNIKVSLKDKQEGLINKIAEADVEDIYNALIALDIVEDPDADEEEEDEVELGVDEFKVVGSPARKEKVTELFNQYKEEYKEGGISDKDIKEFLKDYYNENPNELNLKLPKDELAEMYCWIHANLVDEDGEEVEFGEAYEVDGTYWSCSKELVKLDNGDMYCTVTGDTYEA